MSKYRIVRATSEGSYFSDTYTVQKKSWFGFWYNFENFDCLTTGVYSSIEMARYAIDKDRHRSKTTKSYIGY